MSSAKGRKPGTPPTEKRLASGVTQSSRTRTASSAKRDETISAFVSESLTM